jgi:hypothetical protein
MSRLRDLLDRLLGSLVYNGEPIERLKPGLTRSEIEEAFAGLPFRPTKDLVELYEWRNGTEDRPEENIVYLIPMYRMVPLQEAVAWARWNYEQCAPTPNGPKEDDESGSALFPFLAFDDLCYFCVECDPAQRFGAVYDEAPILERPPTVIADDLASFFAAVVECWETRVYDLKSVQRIGATGIEVFNSDRDAVLSVFRKYRRSPVVEEIPY